MQLFKRRLRQAAAIVLTLLFIIAVYLWLLLVAPFGFDYPIEYYPEPAEQPSEMAPVFVYGTLRYPLVRLLVMRSGSEVEPAVLEGFRREGLDLRPEAEGQVEGLLLTVSQQQLRRLDRYERLGVRYGRERLRLQDGTLAWVYRRCDSAIKNC